MAEVNYRMERVERLLHELRYEVERGIMENEIEEEIQFRFYVPVSRRLKNGTVFCEFRSRPIPYGSADPNDLQPKLKVVK